MRDRLNYTLSGIREDCRRKGKRAMMYGCRKYGNFNILTKNVWELLKELYAQLSSDMPKREINIMERVRIFIGKYIQRKTTAKINIAIKDRVRESLEVRRRTAKADGSRKNENIFINLFIKLKPMSISELELCINREYSLDPELMIVEFLHTPVST